jgi:glucosamine--fructose-6-phosphate aminotransferase (isomerizing)
MIAARFGSPLVIGVGRGEYFLASDASPIAGRADRIVYLADHQLAVLTADGFSVLHRDSGKVRVNIQALETDSGDVSLNGYEHYMLKEIYEQPTVLKRTLKALVSEDEILPELKELKKSFFALRKICFIGCGSAYHAGVGGKILTERLGNITCIAETASEFRYSEEPLDSNTLCIFISQSGETADTLAALLKAKEKKARTLSVINVRGSSIARESDNVIYTQAGPEVAVATTKAYLCQLAVLQLLGLFLGEKSGRLTQKEYDSSLKSLSSLRVVIENQLRINQLTEKVAQGLVDSEHIYFIGRHTDYALALEGALKMKEISYIHCEAYPSGELKHGTISLIEKGTPVVAVCLREDVFQKTLSNIKEVKARGGKIIAVTREKFVSDFDSDDTLITAENTGCDNLSALAGIIPLQLLSYHVASLKKCEVDKPRNLAKSVTVE